MTTPAPQQESPWKLYSVRMPTKEDANKRNEVVFQWLNEGLPFFLSWDYYNNEPDRTDLNKLYWMRHSDLPPLPVGRSEKLDRNKADELCSKWGADSRIAVSEIILEAIQYGRKEGRAEGAKEVREKIKTEVNNILDEWANTGMTTSQLVSKLRAIVAGKGEA